MATENHTLSKSTFLRSQQCQKSLFLNRYYPKLRNEISRSQQAVFDKGKEVGMLARQLFPDGVEVPHDNNSLIRTTELIKGKVPVIYEAAFLYDSVFVAVDILVRDGNTYRVFEVKSSTEVKEIYLQDLAVQYYVLAGTGILLSDVSVVYI